MLADKGTLLRQRLGSRTVVRVGGAHNPLSARLVERSGFDAAWASGFEISTAYGVPDASILTMTEYLESARLMNEAVGLPILADCDTGFGDVSNVAHMVRRYEAAGIAAVCIEDKQFPKINSFVSGGQALASIDEFSEKLRVATKTRQGEGGGMMVIARIEALIAGRGLDEALKRAHAYVDAGADAILIHSKSKSPNDILAFAKTWRDRAPLAIVPTTYYSLHIDQIAEAGIRIVIYANHGLRAAVRAMAETYGRILADGGTMATEGQIASVEELFDLQGMQAVAERR